MADLSKLDALEALDPSEESINDAAEILYRMAEVDALHGWLATFRGDELACTGVWPDEDCEPHLDEVSVPVPESFLDVVRPDESVERDLERCRLAVRHGLERRLLELRLMRKALEATP